MPPVARMTAVSRAFISSCVPSSVTVVMQLIAPSGAPARRAASFMISAVREMQRTADGCGLITIGQRALMQIRILEMAVDVGFAEGTIAGHTPKGSGISK